MKKAIFSLFLTLLLIPFSLKADEGMWLLQLMRQQQLDDQMKQRGLQLDLDEIYSPSSVSLKDAVGIFGGGCTGELISPHGLVITNHHCGFSSIQKLSDIGHNYLKDGFWSASYEEELPAEGLSFTFVERIRDVTDSIQTRIEQGALTEAQSFSSGALQKIAEEIARNDHETKGKGESLSIKPYFAGNKYYMLYMLRYDDVRLVATPPSSIGQFGGETDNWMWPRHTGDFSVFRIYADSLGSPSPYRKENIPLERQKFLPISLKGYQEGDFAMIMGFPGRTSRFLTRKEVEQRMNAENTPRILMRDAALKVIREQMSTSEKIAIQYANKLAGISNYWKNSIGMNKAIVSNKLLERKSKEEQEFLAFAKEKEDQSLRHVVAEIDSFVTANNRTLYLITLMSEMMNSLEFIKGQPSIYDEVQLKEKFFRRHIFQENYATIHNRDYDHSTDRLLSESLLPLYFSLTEESERPALLNTIERKYKGELKRYLDDLYSESILSNEKNLNHFLKKPSKKKIEKDAAYLLSRSLYHYMDSLYRHIAQYKEAVDPLHKRYINGLMEMAGQRPLSPDANFTLRLTYGNVKSYIPRDGMAYSHYTTLHGVMEKEDKENIEFTVPQRLKELYSSKDYGRYALPNGEMPVSFLTNNDITGGNSGSPVLNSQGELLGLAFDGNWESLSGDLNFEAEKQRCINVDIRYVLFIIEKFGQCPRLIHEMRLVE